MEHATARDNPLAVLLALAHAECQVLVQLLHQAVMDVAGSDELTLLAEEGRVVDGEEHTHGRLVDGDGRQCLRVLVVADGVADFKSFDAHQRADVARRDLLHLHAAHALEGVQFLDFGLHDAAVTLCQRDVHALAQRATVYAAHGDTSGIGRVVQRSHQHLRRAFQLLGSRDVLQNAVQQGADVVGLFLPVGAHPVVLCRTVDDGEVQLVFGGVQAEHQVEHHFVHLFGAAVGLIDLVHHHDGFQTYLQRFLQHEAGLRHGTLEGIHQQDAAVRHVEHTLHFAAEVAVSRSINNVNLGVFVVDGNVLRENRYASLAFQVVVIQH